MQGENAPPSIWHLKVTSGSASENESVALPVALGFGGAESIVGVGGRSEAAPEASGTASTRAASITA